VAVAAREMDGADFLLLQQKCGKKARSILLLLLLDLYMQSSTNFGLETLVPWGEAIKGTRTHLEKLLAPI
jgi:hypothetical protein